MNNPDHFQSIIKRFLYFVNQVKIYHWRTYSYSRHKASDKLFKAIIESSDEFVETFLGKTTCNRKKMFSPPIQIPPLKALSDEEMSQFLNEFAFYLTSELQSIIKRQPDLLNIRDTILGQVNQTLYLFSLR